MTDVDEVLRALADPTRRRVLDVLAVHVGATATALAVGLPVTRQAIVKHLAVLEKAGLVHADKHGREVRYTVRPDCLSDTARWMTRLADQWQTRLADIKRIAEEEP